MIPVYSFCHTTKDLHRIKQAALHVEPAITNSCFMDLCGVEQAALHPKTISMAPSQPSAGPAHPIPASLLEPLPGPASSISDYSELAEEPSPRRASELSRVSPRLFSP